MPACERVSFGYRAGSPVLEDFSLVLPETGVVCLLGVGLTRRAARAR